MWPQHLVLLPGSLVAVWAGPGGMYKARSRVRGLGAGLSVRYCVVGIQDRTQAKAQTLRRRFMGPPESGQGCGVSEGRSPAPWWLLGYSSAPSWTCDLGVERPESGWFVFKGRHEDREPSLL